jgi:hypothetical protein
MAGMARGTHRQLRSQRGEIEDRHGRSRLAQHVGNPRQARLEPGDGVPHVDAVGQLGQPIHATVAVGRVVLDGVAQDLGVADQGEHMVRRVDFRGEQADLLHDAVHAAGQHMIPDPERMQDQDEGAGGEIRQEPAPGRPDRDADGRDQSGEAGRLDPELSEDGDHQKDVHTTRRTAPR